MSQVLFENLPAEEQARLTQKYGSLGRIAVVVSDLTTALCEVEIVDGEPQPKYIWEEGDPLKMRFNTENDKIYSVEY